MFSILSKNLALSTRLTGGSKAFTNFFHSSSLAEVALKTKQAAAKRLLKTSSGGIKYGHAGKSHLNMNKSRNRIRRLNEKSRLGGVWEKKMNKLLQG